MKIAKPEWLAAEAERIVRILGCYLGGQCLIPAFQLIEVEASRDLSQTIVHVDMDAFVSILHPIDVIIAASDDLLSMLL